MCTCLATLKKELRDQVKKEITEKTDVYAWEDEGNFSHVIFVGNLRKSAIGMTFQFSYTRRKNSGEPEKKITNGYITVAPKFCPFCGEKIIQ